MNRPLDFGDLKSDPNLLKRALNGSCVNGPTIEAWEDARSFIAGAIHRSGTILDIGCANGFLLRSLQEWSNHALEPFGMDASKSRIRDTAAFFPDRSRQFTNLPIEQFSDLSRSLPDSYDFLYWNVWDDYLFDTPDRADLLKMAFDRVAEGGRLIMGFYDRHPEIIEEKISLIRQFDLGEAFRLDNPDGPQVMMYLQK
jgi:SAM-dependent methyltransferase